MDEQPERQHEKTPEAGPAAQRPPQLRRSRSNRVIAGVAGGIAEHFNIDPTIVRLAWVALAIFAGGGVILYLVAWLLMAEDDTPPGERVTPPPRDDTAARYIIGGILIMIGVAALAGPITVAFVRIGIPAVLIVIGLAIILMRR